jgi:predicted small lipoprotein YifL
MKKFAALLVALLTLAACDKQGPLERAGEEIDEAVENARAGGETLENRLDDAVDDARRGIEDAAEELER